MKNCYKVGCNVVTKWDSFLAKKIVTKWDGGCYKVGQVLHSETDVVTKWDRCYKVRGMLLQSGTGVTKCDNCYKVGSNTDHVCEMVANVGPYYIYAISEHSK